MQGEQHRRWNVRPQLCHISLCSTTGGRRSVGVRSSSVSRLFGEGSNFPPPPGCDRWTSSRRLPPSPTQPKPQRQAAAPGGAPASWSDSGGRRSCERNPTQGPLSHTQFPICCKSMIIDPWSTKFSRQGCPVRGLSDSQHRLPCWLRCCRVCDDEWERNHQQQPPPFRPCWCWCPCV